MTTEIHSRAAVQRNALVIIAVIVAGAAFYWLGAILTPLALALFLMVMIDSFARVLARAPNFPALAALPVAIVLSIAGFGLIAFMVADNAAAFAGQLLNEGPKFDSLIARLASAMHLAVPPTIDQLIQQLNPSSYIGGIVQGLQGFATTAVFVMIYLGFLLASRQGFERKTRGLFLSDEARHDAARVFQRIRAGVERYLWVQAVACGIIALASWAVIAALGLQNALFWAFLIFLVGYVPVIGGAIGILLPPLFALVQYNDWWHAAVMLAGLQVINFVVGNIVYPRMQGKSLNIDPLVVLLSLAFWGAIWGLPGLFLSTPLTVAAMVILAQFHGSRWIAVLLSSDGDPLGDAATSVGAVKSIAAPVSST
ncbi:MAG TPA: AI-2E family transporter [Caulobacteraceae bacterium]|jgi:predicted PurR-regulated permease PerM|nr:AI-2E family transporter [Caulobacteraceae bacterium]